MELTYKQQEGLRIALERYHAGQRYTTIAGYAGSGKSTLIKFIIEALCGEGVNPEKVAYACFTGKAAQVLIEKGNKNAITLHKLLYKAQLMSNGRYYYKPKTFIEYDIVVVDECSMVPTKMVEQLAKHKDTYFLFCGDPFQLPPINPEDNNHLLDAPHVFLDQIMRQAQDSGIIRLSMKIREGLSINGFESLDANVISSNTISRETLMNSDINLCATNATRTKLNQFIRNLKGFTGDLPNEGEKIINLHNEWDICSLSGNAMTNGCIGYLSNIFESSLTYFRYGSVPTINGNFVTETGDDFGYIETDKQLYLTGEPSISGKDRYKIRKANKDVVFPLEFDYAYAITCHKAQGSEWPSVLVLEESFPFAREDHRRWLYTAVTRASKEVKIYTKI